MTTYTVQINPDEQAQFEASNTSGDPIRPVHTSYIAGDVYAATLSTVTTSGTVSAGAWAVSVANTGDAAGTIAGGSIPAGTEITWRCPVGSTLAAIAYDATGTTFLISVSRIAA